MPKASSNETLARQWAMLQKIPARTSGITAKEMTDYLNAEGFPVSKRTVERDLIELSALFGYTSNEKSTPYGWYYPKTNTCPLAGLELSEAISLNVAESLLRKMLPSTMLTALESRFAQAKNMLSALEGNRHIRLAEKVRYIEPTLNTPPPSVPLDILDSVQTALLEEKQIAISYNSFQGGETKSLTLHPVSLIQRGKTAYLLATAFDYTDLRLYPLHRFYTANVLDAPARLPKDFSVDDYIASGGMNFEPGKTITLKATLSNELAILLEESPLTTDQTINHRNGHYELTTKITDSWQLRFWILSQGSGIIIQSPKSLREKIKSELQATLNAYGE